MGSLHKNTQLMLEFLKTSFLVLHFSYYTLMTFLVMFSVMMLLSGDDAICSDDTALYSKCDLASDPWQQLEMAAELECDLRDTMEWDKKWLADFNAVKTQFVLFDWSNNTGTIDVGKDVFVLEEKSSFKMLGLSFSSNLDWDFYIMSVAKTTSKKIGAVILSMKFLSP